jgi:hypothetical protein
LVAVCVSFDFKDVAMSILPSLWAQRELPVGRALTAVRPDGSGEGVVGGDGRVARQFLLRKLEGSIFFILGSNLFSRYAI